MASPVRLLPYLLLFGCATTHSRFMADGTPILDVYEIRSVHYCFTTTHGVKIETTRGTACPSPTLLSGQESDLMVRLTAVDPMAGTDGMTVVVTDSYLLCGNLGLTVGCAAADLALVSTHPEHGANGVEVSLAETYTHELGHMLRLRNKLDIDEEHLDCKWWWQVDQANWPKCKDYHP